MGRVASIILGGGQGSRLFPLTHTCCKPALSFGGRFHLIDIPMSNALNSGIDKIYIITQFLAASLHRHIFNVYQQRHRGQGFIEMLSAEEKPSKKAWFQGTADAVRQNLHYFLEAPVDYFLILSGDQLYHFDFQQLLRWAEKTQADLVIASIPIPEHETKRMGILTMNEKAQVVSFVEKPQDPQQLQPFLSPPSLFKKFGLPYDKATPYLASMGIYLFKRQALFDLLALDEREDFGKHLIPTMIRRGNVSSYLFQGYWEDIGTVRAFYEANIALTQPSPLFNCYDERKPIFTDKNFLPGPKILDAQISHSILCEGSLIEGALIKNSLLGPRSIIRKGCTLEGCYIMGNNHYTPHFKRELSPENHEIGEHCTLRRVIVDKHAQIGHHVQLINKNQLLHYDSPDLYIREGIIIVPRGAFIPDHFVL